MCADSIIRSVWFGLVFLIATPLSAQDTEKKLPVPSDAAQAQAMKLFKEVYGDEYAHAKTTDLKKAMAEKLLKKAEELSDDPTSKFVLLKIAKDISVQAVDGEQAFQAIDKMAEAFQINSLEMKTAVLTGLAKKARTAADHKSIAEQALSLMDEAVGADNLDTATQLGELALPEARRARDSQLLSQVKAKVIEVSALAKSYEEVKAAMKVLEDKPTDPAANVVVGRYLCFAKGDWDKGVAMLALGNDDLRATAILELRGAASSDEQMKLADAWWELSEKEGFAKKQLQGRARYWYQKASFEATGLVKGENRKAIGIDRNTTTRGPRNNELISNLSVATRPPCNGSPSLALRHCSEKAVGLSLALRHCFDNPGKAVETSSMTALGRPFR